MMGLTVLSFFITMLMLVGIVINSSIVRDLCVMGFVLTFLAGLALILFQCLETTKVRKL